MIFRYDDDKRFKGPWEKAPGWGVQTVAFVDLVNGPTLRHQGNNGTYFRLDEDGDVVIMDRDDLLHYVVDTLKIVKVGTMVSREKWKRIYQHAREDMAELREGTD